MSCTVLVESLKRFFSKSTGKFETLQLSQKVQCTGINESILTNISFA